MFNRAFSYLSQTLENESFYFCSCNLNDAVKSKLYVFSDFLQLNAISFIGQEAPKNTPSKMFYFIEKKYMT